MSFESSIASIPSPSEAALSHSNELVALIRSEIECVGGTIGFDRFMELALYAPGLGYYAAGTRKFGQAGDFVTAPELSPLFSRCVANQAAEVLELVGEGDILEVGAGSGLLAGELIHALLASHRPPRRYLILETSADLKHRQRVQLETNFPESLSYIDWIDDFPDEGFRGVLIANELLDAFPASRFQIVGKEFTEVAVGWEEGRFVWLNRLPDETLKRSINTILDCVPGLLPLGYVSELSVVRDAWVTEMLSRFDKGVALIFDYGYPRLEYYHPQRVDGTLCCYYRHRVHDDPFILPGLQDITTHVDFTALADAARGAKAQVLGFTTQGNFLLGTGLLDFMNEADPGTRQHAQLTSQVKQLILPGQMGDLVKVLALSRGVDHLLMGFGERDLVGQL